MCWLTGTLDIEFHATAAVEFTDQRAFQAKLHEKVPIESPDLDPWAGRQAFILVRWLPG